MFSEEEIIKKREIRDKRKKILLICICVAIGIFLLLGVVVLILSGMTVQAKEKSKEDLESFPDYNFYEPDYDYNIFEDENYMRLDRSVRYNDGMAKTGITDENYTNYPAEIQFMYNAVKFIINGDYAEYNKIFTDDCFKDASEKLISRFMNDEFTMQQLFEIELEYVDYLQSETGKIIYSDILLSYRIRNNNGTFRRDLDANDNGSLPVIYRLISDNTGTKVYHILTPRQYYSGLYD